MIKNIRIILFFCLFQTCTSFCATADEYINALLGQYHRSVTVLEIGRFSGAHLFNLAKKYPGTYVLMDRKLAHSPEILEEAAYKNIVFLHPAQIDDTLLTNLGKCEHFDVVIIRQGDHLPSANFADSLQVLLTLGDHIFIDLPEHMVAAAQAVHACEVKHVSQGQCICYFEMHKTYITKPRWISHEESAGHYGIVSTFDEKRMAKQSTGTTSTWVPGINLVTFLILRGVYPTDKMMRKQLKTFKHINHNDLVLGNIVAQGKNLVPIDFHDKRRNISPEVCIKAALKRVIWNGRLKKNPYDLLNRYSDYLHGHKRKMNG